MKEMLRFIFKDNSFQFNGKNYLHIHGTAMGTKMAVAFANIFMADLENQILSKNVIKPMLWKRYIDDIGFMTFLLRICVSRSAIKIFAKATAILVPMAIP